MKRTLYLFGLILAGLLGALAISTHQASACSCVPPGTPVEELSQSTAVFSGTVVAIKNTPAVGGVIGTADPVWITFQVERIWKGTAQSTLVVVTSRASVSCGYEFQRGQDYLVFARGTLSQLTTSICSRTTPFSAAGEDLAALGEGVAVPQRVVAARNPPWAYLVVAAAGILFLAVLAFFIIRRNRLAAS